MPTAVPKFFSGLEPLYSWFDIAGPNHAGATVPVVVLRENLQRNWNYSITKFACHQVSNGIHHENPSVVACLCG